MSWGQASGELTYAWPKSILERSPLNQGGYVDAAMHDLFAWLASLFLSAYFIEPTERYAASPILLAVLFRPLSCKSVPKISDLKNRVLQHDTLKFLFPGVGFPPMGSYFKSFVKILDAKVWCPRAKGDGESPP